MRQVDRRHCLRWAWASAVTGAGLSLSACGFAPRGQIRFGFERLALNGFAPRSPLGEELRQQLAPLPLRLTPTTQAQVILELVREFHGKTAVASTAAGQVREWQLVLELEYRLLTPADELLLPITALRLTRDLTTTETQALAKSQEEALLRRALRQEAVGLVLRRLAALRLA